MALPLILLILSGAAAAGGIGSGAYGGIKMTDAQKMLESAHLRHDRNVRKFNEQYKKTMRAMDALGTAELEVLNSFQEFADAISHIQGRPEFAELNLNAASLPKYDLAEIKKASIGAGTLLGGLSGAALGAAGAYAASSAAQAAVAALGAASTGTPIAALSGAAATNATLAALGGGSIAAGGGGMALGTVVLGSTTAGVGVLIGGIIFGVVGAKMFDKATDAWGEMKHAEKQIRSAVEYLQYLEKIAVNYLDVLSKVSAVYKDHLAKLTDLTRSKNIWADYDSGERLLVENTVLLVQLLYSMCKVRLVNKTQASRKFEVDMNAINAAEAGREAVHAERLLTDVRCIR